MKLTHTTLSTRNISGIFKEKLFLITPGSEILLIKNI